MYCPSCGAKNEDNVNYCSNCSSQLNNSIVVKKKKSKLIPLLILFLLIAFIVIFLIIMWNQYLDAAGLSGVNGTWVNDSTGIITQFGYITFYPNGSFESKSLSEFPSIGTYIYNNGKLDIYNNDGAYISSYKVTLSNRPSSSLFEKDIINLTDINSGNTLKYYKQKIV